MDKIGFRIFPDFERPSKEMIEKYKGIPSSNIGDMVNRLSCMRGINPYNDKLLLGCAFTVKVPMGDNLMIHQALDLARPGDIIVVDGEGSLERSLAGEIMFSYAAKRGIAGFVFDGAIRDVDGVRNLPIPVYARGITPQGPYKHGPGEINVPIACGGQVVFPGDILVGDADGIVVVRPEYAAELAEKSLEKLAVEEKMLAGIHGGDIGQERHKKTYDRILEQAGGAQICS